MYNNIKTVCLNSFKCYVLFYEKSSLFLSVFHCPVVNFGQQKKTIDFTTRFFLIVVLMGAIALMDPLFANWQRKQAPKVLPKK